MIKSFITPWRLKWYSASVLFGIFLALAIAFFSGQGASIISGRLGGDFPAFYAAGRIVASGEIRELYDISRQTDQQEGLYPDSKGFLPFAYPPFVALVYAPLSLLPYRIAFVFSLIINVAALMISLIFLGKIIKGLNTFLLPVFTLSLTFYPFLKAVLNGQNTALTFMLISLVWRFSTTDRQFLAGIFMGFLLYKPQFAIPLIGIFIVSGRLKIALAALSTGCLIVGISLLFTGLQPYNQWHEFLQWFGSADAIINGHNAISWIGFLDTIFGVENKSSFIIGSICCLLTILIISSIWAMGGTKSDFDSQIALGVVSLVLIPPHVMFYDTGLLVFTYAVILQKIHRGRIELITAVWVFGWAQIYAERLGFSPLFLLAVFTFFLSLILLSVPATRKITERS